MNSPERIRRDAQRMTHLRIPMATKVEILELRVGCFTPVGIHKRLHRKQAQNSVSKPWNLYYSHEKDKIQRVLEASETERMLQQTPLMDACEDGRLQDAIALIAAGADVDAHNWFGHTALTKASACGHLAIVEVLLAAGADVNKTDNYKTTPLEFATYAKHTDIVRRLLVVDGIERSMPFQAMACNVEDVKRLLQAADGTLAEADEALLKRAGIF